jgi:sarcosine oxidase gamma subunit
MFDMTSFSSIIVEGPEAVDFLQRMCSNDVDSEIGKVRYSLLLNEGGGILADVTVIRLDDDRYMVTTGGGSSPGIHGGWLKEHAPDTVSVQIQEGGKATIGLWGPKSRLLLQRCTDADISNSGFPYFTAKQLYVGEVPVIALRVSYVGELGWELWAPVEYGRRLWELLEDAGDDLDVRPMGGGALSSMRLEKGYRLWGTDIDTDSNPYEAGLSFAVDLDTDFVGREALEAAKAEGIDNEITPITPDDSTDPDALARIQAFVEHLGSRTLTVSPDQHDRLVAAVSQLPYLAAVALTRLITDADDRDLMTLLAAGGFRDITRIASGSPTMSRDMVVSNRDAVRDALSLFRHQLSALDAILDDPEALPEDLRTAITLRELEGMSYEEIAQAMECPVGTVRSRIFRAREAIDKRLRPLLA